MIGYRRHGRVPDKPHSVFEVDGALVYEQCVTQRGFDGPFSILYHRSPPHDHGDARIIEPLWPAARPAEPAGPLQRQAFETQGLPPSGTPTTGRIPLLFNGDVTVGIVCPAQADPGCFLNADGDELVYCHLGGGVVESWFGSLPFGPGDYVALPRGIPYHVRLGAGPHRWLWFECRSPLRLPSHYLNDVGQLRMDAPYCARDFRTPSFEPGAALPVDPVVVTKRGDRFTRHRWGSDILDVVGWDGTVYPVVFPIERFNPRVGRIHLPPTVHGTFATARSLVCSFVPRPIDFGDGAMSCPYPHSNVDVDEVIFYARDAFTSRQGIQEGTISHHPAGIPHGPHPGTYDPDIGVRTLQERAVMLDTFEALHTTPQATRLQRLDYEAAWGEDPSS